jgi:septal ring factor EnvC (AmiA/AmiB activator)
MRKGGAGEAGMLAGRECLAYGAAYHFRSITICSPLDSASELYCGPETWRIFAGVNPMSTLSLEDAALSAVVDDFTALEQRVVRAVELVKTERAARTQAEQAATRLQSEIRSQTAQLEQTQEQMRALERDRENVRQRVERLLKQLDEISV